MGGEREVRGTVKDREQGKECGEGKEGERKR